MARTPARTPVHRCLRIVFVAAAALLVLAIGALLALGIPRNAAGMAAKGVCSAAFVAHRPIAGLLQAEVLPASPVLHLISVSVQEKEQRVQARFAGLFEREAQWLPDRGCVLDLGQDPVQAPVRRPVDTQHAWPQGEAALAPDLWDAGVDRARMQQVVRQAFVGAGDPQAANTRAVGVIYKGRALVLQTAPGFEPDTPLHGWSMAKTVLGMLSYKLARENDFNFATPVVDAFVGGREPDWVPAWRQDSRKSITGADLLFMRDGLDSEEDYAPWGSVPRMLWGHKDTAAFAAAAAPDAPAGQRWRYLSQSANLLSAVDRARLPTDAQYWSYPRRALFEPIGAHTATLETDAAGNWVGSSYLWASVGDWARFGLLMLQDGRWDTQQVLPPGWWALASTPSTPHGDGTGYGAMTLRIADPQAGMCRNSGLPPDTLAMSGHWGQIVAMVPSRGAVIVRLGWTFRGGQFDSCAFVAQVLATLPH